VQRCSVQLSLRCESGRLRPEGTRAAGLVDRRRRDASLPALHRGGSGPRVLSATSFPELDDLLSDFVGRLRSLLGANLVGIYLTGSFALDGGDAASDCDFLVVTVGPADPETEQELRRLPQGDLPVRPGYWRTTSRAHTHRRPIWRHSQHSDGRGCTSTAAGRSWSGRPTATSKTSAGCFASGHSSWREPTRAPSRVRSPRSSCNRRCALRSRASSTISRPGRPSRSHGHSGMPSRRPAACSTRSNVVRSSQSGMRSTGPRKRCLRSGDPCLFASSNTCRHALVAEAPGGWSGEQALERRSIRRLAVRG
jgi:Nucleotidyltransferase domain